MVKTFGAGRTLPEKFESLARSTDGAIAIATEDDFIGLQGSETDPPERVARSRLVLGEARPKQSELLRRGQPSIPSDLYGLEYFDYKKTPVECSEEIEAFIASLRP
jgi:hypothetical protein